MPNTFPVHQPIDSSLLKDIKQKYKQDFDSYLKEKKFNKNNYFKTGATFKHILKTLQNIPKTLQHISLFNTFFIQNAKKKLYNTFLIIL